MLQSALSNPHFFSRVISLKAQDAVRSPVTLTMVLTMSKILSTESNNKIPTGGIPTVISIVVKTIVPAPGTAGVPIDANNEVMIIRVLRTYSTQLQRAVPKRTLLLLGIEQCHPYLR